jgi:hypothetical protein
MHSKKMTPTPRGDRENQENERERSVKRKQRKAEWRKGKRRRRRRTRRRTRRGKSEGRKGRSRADAAGTAIFDRNIASLIQKPALVAKVFEFKKWGRWKAAELRWDAKSLSDECTGPQWRALFRNQATDADSQTLLKRPRPIGCGGQWRRLNEELAMIGCRKRIWSRSEIGCKFAMRPTHHGSNGSNMRDLQ